MDPKISEVTFTSAMIWQAAKDGEPISMVSRDELDVSRGFIEERDRISIDLLTTPSQFRFRTTVYPKDLVPQMSNPQKEQPIPEQKCSRPCSEDEFVETFRKTADELQFSASIEGEAWKNNVILTPGKDEYVREIFRSIEGNN